MKRVFVIHGWGGSPQGNWFPWLKNQLEQKGFVVHVPAMPDAKHPRLESWLACLQAATGDVDEETYLIGHSLGVIAILRFLESLPVGKKAGGAILVAGFSEPIDEEELNSFFMTPLDYAKVKDSVRRIIAIHSDDDPYVPMRHGEVLKEKLNAKLAIVKGGRHFNNEDGCTELPIAVEALEEMIGTHQ